MSFWPVIWCIVRMRSRGLVRLYQTLHGARPMACLLIVEPDFGATVVLLGAATGMLFLGGVGLFRFLLLFRLARRASLRWPSGPNPTVCSA
ncbi:hypothetical protein UMZ34_03305 [Halopseudomonas pachastrellae]|nr:hypothetical protein UMZ34_03305 [Halopseudomonas pachastrellae]